MFIDEDGQVTDYDDVFRVIERARRHYIKAGLGADYIDQLLR